MLPALRQGDEVTIAPLAGRVGDVVLYSRGDCLVMHRVVAKLAHRIITKGDAVPRFDPSITDRDILGRAVFFERQGKKQPLDSLAARWLGLAFSLTVSWVPQLITMMAAVKHLTGTGKGTDGSK
jgi:hypothetical protein